ncbi:MAG: hypothetical protein JWM49_1110 [Microbacteriaceae bacterium]|jgi:hypothetical protein|nr:hypothetical protein [Microbacteriaceae bacterium]
MRRGNFFAVTAVLLVLLLLSVFTQVWALPSAVESVVAVFPEVKPLAVPSVIWGVIAIACWQAVGVIGLRIAALARDDRFDASAYGWLRAMVGCLLVFIVLVVSAFVALNVMGYTTPGVMLGLIGGGLIAVIAVGCLVLFLVTRPALRHYSQT